MQPRHAPIWAVIPPPLQYAVTFLAGVGVDRLVPYRPVWLTMGGVHLVGAALTFAGSLIAAVSSGWFPLRRTTLNPAGQPAHLIVRGAHAWSRNPMYLVAHDHLCGHGARAGRSLAVVLGGPAVGLRELGRDSLRGSAPSKSLWPRLHRLLSNGSALDVSPL
jgi:hypothetical protein